MAPPFPRSSHALSADRSWSALALLVLAAAALLGWGLWAFLARVEVEVARSTRPPSPGSRPGLPPAVQIELKAISPAAWLLDPGGDGASRSHGRR